MLPSYLYASCVGVPTAAFMDEYRYNQQYRLFPLTRPAQDENNVGTTAASTASSLVPYTATTTTTAVSNTFKETPASKSDLRQSQQAANVRLQDQPEEMPALVPETPEIKFSIESILGIGKNHSAGQCTRRDEGPVADVCCKSSTSGDDVAEDGKEGDRDSRLASGEEATKTTGDEPDSYPWMQCTRYRPPKIQRNKKKDGGGKKRKLGRNPRVPFTQHQVAVLEEKFRRTHYLSSMDVAELSSALTLSETRVKIWFQNRRARERREREATQRSHIFAQKPYQPLSIPSVTWALTSSSAFHTPFRSEMNMRPGIFTSPYSAFSVASRGQISVPEGTSPNMRSWMPVDSTISDDGTMYN